MNLTYPNIITIERRIPSILTENTSKTSGSSGGGTIIAGGAGSTVDSNLFLKKDASVLNYIWDLPFVDASINQLFRYDSSLDLIIFKKTIVSEQEVVAWYDASIVSDSSAALRIASFTFPLVIDSSNVVRLVYDPSSIAVDSIKGLQSTATGGSGVDLTGRLNITDASLLTLTTRHNFTESSLGTLTLRHNFTESSLGTLTNRHNTTEASVGTLTTRLNTTDTSLNTLRLRHNITEASLGTLTTRLNTTDTSLNTLRLRHNTTEASLGLLTSRVDASFGLYYTKVQIDASFYTKTFIDASLNNKSNTNHTHTGVYEPANANIQAHIASTSNPHATTAAQVGLGNVTNESKTTMFTNPTFTGKIGIDSSIVFLGTRGDIQMNSSTGALRLNGGYSQDVSFGGAIQLFGNYYDPSSFRGSIALIGGKGDSSLNRGSVLISTVDVSGNSIERVKLFGGEVKARLNLTNTFLTSDGSIGSPAFTIKDTSLNTVWTIALSGTDLIFKNSANVNKMKLDQSGNITNVGDVTAFGTI